MNAAYSWERDKRITQLQYFLQPFGELPRIPIPRTWVNKGLLDCLLALPGRIGTQPQRDVSGLHRLSHHSYQVLAQGVHVRFVSQLGREGFQGLSGVVLPAVEAPVYKPLYAASQRREQCRYQEGGCHHCECGLLTREQDEEPLRHDDTAEVERHQCGGQRAVDEGAVYDDVYVVEAVLKNRYPYGDRHGRYQR